MDEYDEYEYECKYCGELSHKKLYCSGYCEYRDTVVVPKKKQILKNYIKEKEKEKEKSNDNKDTIVIDEVVALTIVKLNDEMW